MDLLALRSFRAVARREHLSRAAEELHVSQPAVSRTIARLESELGVPLFDRVGRGLRLNRYGRAFLARVERALAELDDARRELADAAGLGAGTVTVASETLLTAAALLQRFRREHPDVTVELHQSTADRMAVQLREGDVDLCLASQPVPAPDLEVVELVREPVLLAVPVGHRLARRDRVAVADLDGEPLVTLRHGHWQRALADRLFERHGVAPRTVCEGDEPAATVEMVGAGLGVALVPRIGTRAWDDPRVIWVRLDDPGAVRVLELVRRRDSYQSAAAAALRDLAVTHFSEQNSR